MKRHASQQPEGGTQEKGGGRGKNGCMLSCNGQWEGKWVKQMKYTKRNGM